MEILETPVSLYGLTYMQYVLTQWRTTVRLILQPQPLLYHSIVVPLCAIAFYFYINIFEAVKTI